MNFGIWIFLPFFICGFGFIPQITSGNPVRSCCRERSEPWWERAPSFGAERWGVSGLAGHLPYQYRSPRAVFSICLVARIPCIRICVWVSPRAVFSIGLVSRQVSPRSAFCIGFVARIPSIRIWVSPSAVFSIGLVSRQASPRAAFGIALVARIYRIDIWECRHLLCQNLSVSGVCRVRICSVDSSKLIVSFLDHFVRAVRAIVNKTSGASASGLKYKRRSRER